MNKHVHGTKAMFQIAYQDLSLIHIFFSSGEIVSHAGATPVFVDVDTDTFNISVDFLEAAIREIKDEGKLVPKAVVAVDLFGLPADFDAVR